MGIRRQVGGGDGGGGGGGGEGGGDEDEEVELRDQQRQRSTKVQPFIRLEQASTRSCHLCLRCSIPRSLDSKPSPRYFGARESATFLSASTFHKLSCGAQTSMPEMKAMRCSQSISGRAHAAM